MFVSVSRPHRVWLLLLGLLCACCQLNYADDKEGNEEHYEMPFPNLFEDLGRRVHIVSEVFDSHGGYSTREEFVDLNIGKATFITSKSDSRETYHMDAATQSSYYYVPYECYPFEFPKKPTGFPAEGFWISEQTTGIGADKGEAKKMYLTGVAAVWANAKNLPKSYSSATSIYSASKDVYEPAHRWEVNMGDTKASFYFHTTKVDETSDGVALTLETIEVESKDGKKITINVLEYDNVIEDSVYSKELQLPLSYGCYIVGDLTEESREPFMQVVDSLGWGIDNRLELEVVATKISDDGMRSTDTMSLKFLRSAPYNPDSNIANRNLLLMSQRNSRLDTKQVLDFALNVKYEIDQRRGACNMISLDSKLQEEESKMDVKFSNGLELNLNSTDLHALFFDAKKFILTRSTVDENGVKSVYLTLRTSRLFSRTGRDRVVRRYSIRDDSRVKLESVTVWILGDSPRTDHEGSTIKEIYHFTVLESSMLYDESLLARAFDVSQECYLDSENTNGMKYGRDYAWIKIHYNAPHYLFNMRPHPISLHGFYYSMRYYANIWYMRIPRLELVFEEVGFSVRMLLLDSPPLHMIFDRTEGKAIDPKKSSDSSFLNEIAPDLRHCAELCRVHRCEAFSFCASSFNCVLTIPLTASQDRAKFASTLPIVSKGGSTLFTVPAGFEYQKYVFSKLHNFIGQLQQYDLNSDETPELPEELYANRNGFGDELGRQLWKEYYGKTKDYLENRFWHPVSFFIDGLLVIVPDRFEVEQDPLAEFGLDGRDELELDDYSQAPAFHEGLSSYKFNRAAFKDENGDETSKGDDKRPESRRYVGVDFEQCQLACLDGKCSSFSFCRQRQECAITNLWDLQADGGKYIAPDSDCAILQRDFLSKFHKLSGVGAPRGKPVEAATNAAECAHVCVAVSGNSACLAFTFCPTADGSGGGQCYYSTSRSLDSSQVVQSGKSTAAGQCDHYSRSYLADFTRVEYRQILPEALEQLKTSQIEGRSVDSCAETCATELMDCTAFQFCYDPELGGAEAKSSRQVCTLVESPPREKQEDFRVVLGEGGKVLEAGKMFANNPNCHVFSLRKGSSEAELRQLALNPLEKDEADDEDLAQGSSGGLSLAGGFLLFVGCTLVFTAMGIALLAAQRNSQSVRTRIDRLRAIFGRY